MMNVVNAGGEILQQCYPTLLTGKWYPGGTRKVYVTTLYVPAIPDNRTGVDVIELGTLEPVEQAAGVSTS